METQKKTEREVVKFVCDMLDKQGSRSVDTFGACKYMAPDGKKCAVGWLIPDDKYAPHLEGFGVSDSFVRDAIGEEYSDVLSLLTRLQSVHDLQWIGGSFTDAWKHYCDSRNMENYLD